MPDTAERRKVSRTFRFTAPPEIRVEADGTLKFHGYASVFDQPSVEMYGMREFIAPAAFENTLGLDPRVLMLHNHDANLVLSSTDNRTLTLGTDSVGLVVDALWAPTTYAQDIAILYRDGYLSSMSFGFWIVRGHREERNGEMCYIVDEADLDGGDVSTVAYPAYPQTSGEMRARGAVALLRSTFPELDIDNDAVLRSFGGQPVPTTKTTRNIPDPPPGIDAELRARRAVASRAQIRAALNGWTFNDLWPLLDDAVVDLCGSEDFNAYWYVWLVDFSDDFCIYYDSRPGVSDAAYWQVPYTVDAAGAISLGEPFEVVVKTTYLAAPAEPDETDENVPMGSPPGASLASSDRSSIIARERTLALHGKV